MYQTTSKLGGFQKQSFSLTSISWLEFDLSWVWPGCFQAQVIKMYNLQEEQKIEGHIKGYPGKAVSIMQQVEMLQDRQLFVQQINGKREMQDGGRTRR